MFTKKQRFDRLDQAIGEGRVIRKKWTKEHDRVCLLAALSPEVAEARDAHACPAEVVPSWFADITVCMDDCGSEDAWQAFIRRYAAVVRKAADTLDAAGWRQADYRARALAVAEAMQHTQNARVLEQCARVQEECLAVASGRKPAWEEWLCVGITRPHLFPNVSEHYADLAALTAAETASACRTSFYAAATLSSSAASRAAGWAASSLSQNPKAAREAA